MEIGDIFLYIHVHVYLVRETTLCYVKWADVSAISKT